MVSEKVVQLIMLRLVFKVGTLRFLDGGEHVYGVFLDLSQAFDIADHTFQLQKIEPIGLSGNVLGWIYSYISGRRQQLIEILGSDSYGCLRKYQC